MPYEPTWKDRLEDARPYVGPALAALVVVALLAWLAWRQLGATRPRSGAAAPGAAQAEVDALERDYARALEAGMSDAEVGQLLDRAIAKQRSVLQQETPPSSAGTARLARLEGARSTLRGRAALARSELLEKQAAQQQAGGHVEEAKESLRNALRLAREANANLAGSELRDLPREARLAAQIEEADAAPLHTNVTVAETLARAAATREEWPEAAKGYADARAAQLELNRKFPGSRYADVKAIDRFDAELASINAAGLAGTLATRVREGEAAAAAGRADDAGKAFGAAIDLQREINAKFPQSRFASTAQLDALATRRDTVLSAADVARVADLDREAALMLQGRQVDRASEKIRAALTLLGNTVKAFPHRRATDLELPARLAYLDARGDDLAAIQEQVHARLVRSPLSGTTQILGTEVAQELYARVMEKNPSRNEGRARPVDSVSWADAHEFCRRLAWILGARVRLPTELEFRAAFGSAADAWSADNSEGHSHDVGTSPRSPAGVADIAGNVAEWLEPATEAGDTALVAGGSYLDSAEALRQLPIVSADRRERARHIGFRVVVEWPAN